MLAVIPLMAGALVFTAFDNVFPSFFSIIMALWVLTNSINFSSWSCHGVHQENGSTAHYNKLSYIRTLPKFVYNIFHCAMEKNLYYIMSVNRSHYYILI